MHSSIRSGLSVRVHGTPRIAGAIFLILIFSFAIASTACSGSETETNSNSAPPPAEAAKSAPQRVLGDTAYSVDSINSQALPKTGAVVVNSANTPSIIVAGWAVDGQAKAPAGGVILSIDGKSELTATYGAERPDVATVLKEPNYKLSGFGVAIPTGSLEKGKHTIALKILTSDKKGYYEPNRKFDIEIQ